MYFIKGLLVLLMLFFIANCATFPQANEEEKKKMIEQPSCTFKGATIWIGTKYNEYNEWEIISVGSAHQEQLKVGDVILKVDDIPLKSHKILLNIMDTKTPGESVNLTIRRNGKIVEQKVQSQEEFIYHDAKIIGETLRKGKPVRLAILIGDILYGGFAQPLRDYEGWKRSIKSQVLSRTEGGLLRALQRYDNFLVIDREKVENSIKEMEFQQTGLVSDNRIKIGNMFGATHLLLIDITRAPASYPYSDFMDVETRRLIEIESGKTIASVTCRGGK
jgi:hypothetical protein